MSPEFKRAGAMQERVLGRSYWSETLIHCLRFIALKQSSWGRWGRNRKRRRNLVLKVNLVSVNNSSANY